MTDFSMSGLVIDKATGLPRFDEPAKANVVMKAMMTKDMVSRLPADTLTELGITPAMVASWPDDPANAPSKAERQTLVNARLAAMGRPERVELQ